MQRTMLNILKTPVALVTLFSVLVSVGLWAFVYEAQAAQLTVVSATLGSSKPATATNLQVKFTTATQVNGDTTNADDDGFIYIRFQTSGTDPFTLASLVTGDITLAGFPANVTVQSAALADADSDGTNDTIKIGLNQTNAGSALDIAAATALTVTVINNKITTPAKVAAAGTADIWPMSFATRANGDASDVDTGATHLATVDATAVSASINTTLALAVAGINTGTSVFGVTTDVTTTATTVPFGTMAPGSTNAKEAAQQLTISTNAPSGYNVYILQSQNLTAGSDTIDQFKDGTRVDDASASAWASPAVKVSDAATWGHLGYGSTQTAVFASSNTWAGIATRGASGVAPVTDSLVCKNTAAAVNDDCDVAFKVETSALQPAGSYTNEVYYVITANY